MDAGDPKPGTARLAKPIAIFSTGRVEDDHGAEDFGRAQLDRMAQNFAAFKRGWKANGHTNAMEVPGFYVPNMPPGSIGVGHDADQKTLRDVMKRGDTPASGWLDDVYRDGDFLMGTFSEMPAGLAEMINTGRLKTWSAEVYRDYVDDSGKHWGPTLRRVAFLGADQPKRKDLGTFPKAILFSEGAGRRRAKLYRSGNSVVCFSEGTSMDRNAIIAGLQAAGFDPSKITDAVPDDALAEMLRVVGLKDSGAPVSTNDDPPADPAADPAADGDLTAEDKLALIAKVAGDPVSLNDETDPEDKADPAMHDDTAKPAPKPPAKPVAANAEKKATAALFSEMKKEIASLKTQVAKVAQQTKTDIRNKVAVFCEEQSRAGRITPAQLPAQIKIGQTLLDTPAYADWEAEIRGRRAVANFSEGVGQPAGGGSTMTPEERAKYLGGYGIDATKLKK